MQQSPPRPLFALTLGVTGHRGRDANPAVAGPGQGVILNEDKVRAAIDAFLATLLQAVADLSGEAKPWFDPSPPVVALVSSLAEGADRIAARAALARAMPLDVVLPCARSNYEQTFADDAARADFAALFERARARLILPLPAAPGASHDEQLARAYEAAGLTMLAQADILIAVWDGEPAKGRGGTAEIVDEAARQGAPIVVVDPRDGATRLLWSGGGPLALPARRARDLTPAPADRDALRAIARALVLPPHSAHERAGLAMYLATRAPAAGKDWPAAERPTPGAASPSNRLAATRLYAAFATAGAIAQENARAFRLAFFRNFIIGAVAAAFIAASLVRDALHPWFVAVELALALWVVGSTFRALRQQWHRRWFEAREVAERLRVAETFWMLGVWPHNLTPAQPSWAGWYARATLRAQPLFSGDLVDLLAGVRATLVALLEDQRRYHADNVAALERRDRALEVLGAIFLGLSLANGALFLIGHWSGWPMTPQLISWSLAAAIFLPSAAAACYGIRLFGDYEDIVRRSRRTGAALDALQPLLARDPDDLLTLRARAGQAAAAMLSDLEAWRVAVESRFLAAA
jgi:hypothetical protein